MNIAYGNYHSTQNKINTGTQSVSNDNFTDVAVNVPIINIHAGCRNLKKLDVGSASDPMVVMFIPFNGQNVEIARTEVIWNNPNPQFVKFFQAMYIFETHQPLRFNIYDVDSEKAPLENHDLIGYVETDVQHLISNTSASVEFEIQHPSHQKRGKLILTIEQAVNSGSYFDAAVSVNKLKKVNTFSKNKPYVQFSKPSEAGVQLPVYRTEVIHGAYSCTFKPFSLPLQTLCNADLAMPITMTVMDYSSKKEDKVVGSYSANVTTLVNEKGKTYEIHDKKSKKTGEIKLLNPIVIRKPTFYDYLRSGLQLNLITAIDFTASNRDPKDPRSLHYLSKGQMNQYETCIWSVGSIICPYDTDQLFAVYGFGGKINGQINHCFPLTFDPSHPTVQGLQNIVNAYKNSLNIVQLSGPTLFTPIIQAATGVAIESFHTSHTYTILLILTDGVINDMNETVDAIVAASDSPLSIVIVGVGDANFDAMERLDGDRNKLVSSTNVQAKRDIVQFVPFRKYSANSGMMLASEVLAEIPTQVNQYCSTHGFIPHLQ
ncbi:hypothetical protein M9Y10_021933 [Tritrichomonas musculus]|uniref:C2 domain-containing protein n=1 Tax=Tritrichomonas musculus TaxID=1915356 RepID=A0ABR2KRX1_9EUKA